MYINAYICSELIFKPEFMNTFEINSRYTLLANDTCCLSCGGAINHAKPFPGEVCVDLGSGRGTDVLRMATDVGVSGYVYGLDISDGMLEKARKSAVKLGVINVEFIQCELENISLQNNSVDLLISNCTINHAANKQAVWNHVHRILKPGGRFVVSDIYSLEEVPTEFKNDPVAIAECWAGSVTREVYVTQLEQAGFSNIQILEESAPYNKGQIRVSSFTIKGIK
jgi:ubiquinone/menaquinone biosynthesis C-methylase UbiE